MPQTVEAEIRAARRIPGAISLRTVGRITADSDRPFNRSRLIERDKRNTGVVCGTGIIGVAVAVIAGVIGVVVAIVVRTVAVTTRSDRGTGGYACGRGADGKSGIAPVATAAITAELPAAAPGRITASGSGPSRQVPSERKVSSAIYLRAA